MKKVLMIFVLVAWTVSALAQNTFRETGTVTIQPKFGVAVGYLAGNWTSTADNKLRAGVALGVEAEYYAAPWIGIAAGVNYAMQGWKWSFQDSNDKIQKYNYINIPAVCNFYVVKGLALKTGVQVGFLLNAHYDDVDIKDASNTVSFAIPVGLSYESGNIILDARYNFAVTHVNKNATSVDKWRSDLIQLTIGYKFEL